MPDATDLVEVAILWLLLYAVLRFLRRTIAGGIFRGTGLLVWPVLLGVFLLFHWLELEVVGVLAREALPVLLVGLIVVFQTELRHGIARLGQTAWVRRLTSLRRGGPRATVVRAAEEIVQALFAFRERRVGALVVIERSIDLSTYADTGVKVDAVVRKELLDALFQRGAVLHDGAVIVRGDRIAAASCYLPLTERPLDLAYGTRHRAAVGLSEVSDALVLVTSEERGQVAVAEGGTLTTFQDPRWLAAKLNVVLAERQGLTGVASGGHLPPPPPVPSPARPPGRGASAAPAAPDVEPAGAAEAARRGLGARLGSELGLLALSLVLALMVWGLVRNTVASHLDREVEVLAVAPPGFRALTFGTVQLRLRGTRGELQQAGDRLDAAGGRLVLEAEGLPENVDERLAFRSESDRYRLPFPQRLLEDPSRPPLPAGEVVRLSPRAVPVGRVQVSFRDPQVAEGLRAVVEVEPRAVEVLAPYRSLEGDLVPDPIDGDRLRTLAGGTLGVPQRVPLSFEGWRAGRQGERVGEDVVRRRATVELPAVTATVTLALMKEEAITNELVIFLRPTHQVREIEPLPPERGTLTGTFSSLEPGRRPDVTYTGRVRATADLLEDLGAHKDAWRWVLVVPDADLPTSLDKPATVTATLTLVAFGDLREALEQGFLVSPEVPVSVQVALAR